MYFQGAGGASAETGAWCRQPSSAIQSRPVVAPVSEKCGALQRRSGGPSSRWDDDGRHHGRSTRTYCGEEVFPGTGGRVTTTRRSRATILDAIGSTPLIEIDGIWVKLEYLNPSGSIKARMARYIIERAEREGLLRPGDTIVEASSGNTGNAMSMVAAVKGYKMLVVMPEGLSPERTAISVAFGAQVHYVGNFHVNEALEEASRLGELPGHFAPHQFESEWNVEENRTWLGPELLSQLPRGRVPDAFVMGVGTGGTLIGVGQALRVANPNVLLVALEPSESCTILCGDTGLHRIEGISDGFIPLIYQRHQAIVDRVIAVHSDDAEAEMRRLASVHGLLVGPSSGANLVAAKRLRDELPARSTVVTICADEGEKYLSEYFIS
jgi:cysteine synthase A